MHIPDGFLTTPLWLSLDVVSVPVVGWFGRRAQAGTDESKAPLLGLMGAFVFAAQMINFPVGPGTSGHLLGAALLAFTLGPAAAVVVMTAVLALQALIFQDGGLLALGANVFNMAVCGVLAGYLPYRYWGAGRLRRAAVFAGGALSVFVAASLAIVELLLSGIRIPGAILGASMAVFAVSAVIEGVITVAVLEALERINPSWVERRPAEARPAMGLLALASVLLVTVGVLFASAAPDGLEKLAEEVGISGRARALIETPLADYEATFISGSWAAQAAAGLAGLLLAAALGWALARMIGRRRRA